MKKSEQIDNMLGLQLRDQLWYKLWYKLGPLLKAKLWIQLSVTSDRLQDPLFAELEQENTYEIY